MHDAGRISDEKRLVGVDLMDARHPVDRVIGHDCDQVPSAGRLAKKRIDLGRIAEQVWLLLIGIATNEAVKVLKAHAGWPLIEWPSLAGSENWCVVVLTEPGSRVAVD